MNLKLIKYYRMKAKEINLQVNITCKNEIRKK
jgi:hypothetical protein